MTGLMKRHSIEHLKESMIVEMMGKNYLNEWMIELMKRHLNESLKKRDL